MGLDTDGNVIEDVMPEPETPKRASGYPFPTLSFSSINQFGGYGSCELNWMYDRLEHRPPDRKKGLQLALGNAFDAAAMLVFGEKIKGNIVDGSDAVGALIDEWKEQVASDEYDLGTDQGSSLPGLAPNAVRQLVTDVAPNITPLATQHPVRIAFEEVPWELVAKIDLLAESATPGFEDVLDTKATASSSTQYEPAADMQLNLYSLARTMEGANVGRKGFVTARILKTLTRVETPSAPDSNAARELALDQLVVNSTAIETACETGNFRPTAFQQRSWKCSAKFCDYYPTTCPFGARGRTAFAVPEKP
jgi:hypothetical protein